MQLHETYIYFLTAEGIKVGAQVGLKEGFFDGTTVGIVDGRKVGFAVGLYVGAALGGFVGLAVGLRVLGACGNTKIIAYICVCEYLYQRCIYINMRT